MSKYSFYLWDDFEGFSYLNLSEISSPFDFIHVSNFSSLHPEKFEQYLNRQSEGEDCSSEGVNELGVNLVKIIKGTGKKIIVDRQNVPLPYFNLLDFFITDSMNQYRNFFGWTLKSGLDMLAFRLQSEANEVKSISGNVLSIISRMYECVGYIDDNFKDVEKGDVKFQYEQSSFTNKFLKKLYESEFDKEFHLKACMGNLVECLFTKEDTPRSIARKVKEYYTDALNSHQIELFKQLGDVDSELYQKSEHPCFEISFFNSFMQTNGLKTLEEVIDMVKG